MTSPAHKSDGSWSASDHEPSPEGRTSGEGESRHLSVLVLEEAASGGVTLASILGSGGSGVEHSDDRGPVDADIQPDAIVVDLSSTAAESLNASENHAFTDAYLVLLDERGSPERIVGLPIETDESAGGPESSKDLASRIAAMVRRHRGPGSGDPRPRQLADLTIDPATREVRRSDEEIDLTRMEFDILDALSARPRAVLTRTQLLRAVWGPDWYGNDHVVDVHMSKLRRKLGDSTDAPRYIRTVRGVGFHIAPDAIPAGA